MTTPIKQMISMARGYTVDVAGFLNNQAALSSFKEITPEMLEKVDGDQSQFFIQPGESHARYLFTEREKDHISLH